MILAIEPRAARRLAEIEAEEGLPQTEIVHEAIDVWSHLRGDDERHAAKWAVMQIVARRGRENPSGAGGRT